MPDRPHAPSLARAIAQEAKQGGEALRLAGLARAIEDPYHAAWALAHVAADADLPTARIIALVAEAGPLARRVPEPWRRAELVVELGRVLIGEGVEPAVEDAASALLIELLGSLEAGKPLAAAVQGLAPRLARRRGADLLRESRRGNETLEDGKAVVAAWVQAGAAGNAEAERLRAALETLPPPLAARLLGHLHLQAGRAALRLPFVALAAARDAALRIADEAERAETLRLVALDAAAPDELRLLHGALPVSPAARGRLLSAIAAQADRLGDAALSEAWFLEAAAAADAVGDAKAQAALRRNAAQGLRRLGKADEANRLGALAADGRPRGTAPAAPSEPAPAPGAATVPAVPAAPGAAKRPILALHNAYDGALAKPHLQAVARAAPLAAGFGFDLALVGFPVADVEDLVLRVEADTQVGEGRGLAARLSRDGRILLVPRDVHGQPHKWGVADHYVATTQAPDPAKPADLPALLGRGRVCVIMGLGSRGLPRQLLDAAPFHLELTGAGVPLETATVMGVVAERLGALRVRGGSS